MRWSSSHLTVIWESLQKEWRVWSSLVGPSGVSLSQCFPKSVTPFWSACQGRSHGLCTAVPVQPLFAEWKGAESYSVRNCFIFWLMSESFIITALIRLITATLINKMLPETAFRVQHPPSQSTQVTLSRCCSLLKIFLEYTSALRREFWCVKTLLINPTDHDMPLLKALLLGH